MATKTIERPNPKIRLRPAMVPIYHPGSSAGTLLSHPLVISILHILRELCVGSGVRLVSSDGRSISDLEQSLFESLQDADQFDFALRHLVEAYLIGSSAAEILWSDDFRIEALRPIPIAALQIGLDEIGYPATLRVTTAAGNQLLPLENAVLFIHNPTLSQPAGQSVLLSYKRYLDAYDTTLKSLHLYIQRHGTPTTLAQVPSTYTESEVELIQSALERLQDALVATIPASPDAKIEFLEPRGTGMELSLRLMELLERLFVRAILGSVLAIYEAQYGTRAQATVHWEVMKRVIESMQRPLEQVINKQLWRRFARLHLPEPVGRVELNEPSIMPRENILRNLGDLTALGIIDPESDRDWLRSLIATET